MTGPASRRGFLRDLVGLPLIGGGLTLIGSPTTVAEPVTLSLLTNYETWLQQELVATAKFVRGDSRGFLATLYTPAWYWHMRANENRESPEHRAALVLSAVGCDWREGGQ